MVSFTQADIDRINTANGDIVDRMSISREFSAIYPVGYKVRITNPQTEINAGPFDALVGYTPEWVQEATILAQVTRSQRWYGDREYIVVVFDGEADWQYMEISDPWEDIETIAPYYAGI